MKATSNKSEFKPFEIIITVESVSEAESLYALFNHTQILAAVKIDGEQIRRAIENVNGIPAYTKAHGKLCEIC